MSANETTDVRKLETELHELKKDFDVQQATQAGVDSTMAATQAGQTATTAAAQAGTWSTVAVGGVALTVGMFLALALVGIRSN